MIAPLFSDFLPKLYDNLNTNSITSLQDILIVLGNILRICIAAAGALAVIFILASAVFYIASNGEPSQIKKAKDMLINSIVGLAIVMVSYTAVTFIASKF